MNNEVRNNHKGTLVLRKASRLFSFMRGSLACRWREIIVFSVQHLVGHTWSPGSSSQLSSVRKAWPCWTEWRATNMMKELENPSRLRELALFILGEKRIFFFLLPNERVIWDNLWDVSESLTSEIFEIQLDMVLIKLGVRLVLHDIQRFLSLSAILWLCGTTLSQKCQF